MFAKVPNKMQIHNYTSSKHGKCHNCSCGVVNLASTICAIVVNM